MRGLLHPRGQMPEPRVQHRRTGQLLECCVQLTPLQEVSLDRRALQGRTAEPLRQHPHALHYPTCATFTAVQPAAAVAQAATVAHPTVATTTVAQPTVAVAQAATAAQPTATVAHPTATAQPATAQPVATTTTATAQPATAQPVAITTTVAAVVPYRPGGPV